MDKRVIAGELSSFLGTVWGLYASYSEMYFELFAKNGRSIIRFFKGFNAARKALNWVLDNWDYLAENRFHVWYGVLPRKRRPNKGRGREIDVELGLFLWADLDFKTPYQHLDDVPVDEELREQARINGYAYRELEDHALIGIYRAGDKWILVERPPLTRILDEIREKLGIEPYIVVDSGGGYHFYFKLAYEIDAKRLKRLEEKLVDVLKADPQSKDLARVLRLPGTINPRLNRLVRVIRWGRDEVDPEQFEEILDKLLSEKREKKREGRTTRRKKLTDEQVERIVELLKPYYVPGYRNKIVYSLLGLMVKSGIMYDSAYQVVEKIATLTEDEEIRERLYLVDYHYDKRKDVVGIDKLKGISGLREVLEEQLRSQGLTDDEVTQKSSETIAQLYTILGLKRMPGVAWLERKGGFIRKWVAVGRQGIYLYKRKEPDETPLVKIVSSVLIREAKRIKILGLDLKNLYMVKLDGETISGTLSDITSYIKTYYGIEKGSEYAIQRLIEYMAEEEEEQFYAPGPWVVDNRIVYAYEPGYTPTWKPYIVWKIPSEEIDDEKIREALKKIKQLVESYSNPGKASLVLSYAAIAPLAHYIKKELSIMPHLLIHGLEGTGKSILLETIKLIYNITWNDPFPGSDYQARKCLATSTLPAIIDEIGDLIEGYSQKRRNSVEAIEILHRAATQELLKAAGGHTYGGYYLAIRSIIAATNSDISLVPWQLDKFIIVSISKDDRIILEKARGATPRTMNPDIKFALKYIGKQLLAEQEKLLAKITEMKKMSREEIRRGIIRLGYRAWRNLYEEYGLEAFPEPVEPETEIEKTNIEETYRDVFHSYIKACEETISNKYNCYIHVFQDRQDPNILEYLDKYLAIIYAPPDKQERYLIMKIAFLSRFIENATKEYGLPRLGWRRLSEILGIKRTSIKIDKETVRNILVLPIE